MASTSNQTISSLQCSINIDFDTQNVTEIPSSVIQSWISVAAINTITSPPTVLINFLVIWTVLEKEQLRSNNYYLLVAILSLGDLLVGLVVQPLLVALIVATVVQYSRLCELVMANVICAFLCYEWCIVAMATVSLERYFYIKHPLYYHTSVTSKKITIAATGSWIIIVVSTILTRFLVDNSFWARQLPAILTLGPSFVIILFCVAKINLTARRQMRAIAAQQPPAAQQSKVKEYKRSLTLGLLVLANVACLSPILIMKIVVAVKGDWSEDLRYVTQFIYFTCLNMQSLINPIIYSLRLSEIRSGIAKRLCLSEQL